MLQTFKYSTGSILVFKDEDAMNYIYLICYVWFQNKRMAFSYNFFHRRTNMVQMWFIYILSNHE